LINAGLALEVWDEANPACASRDENRNRHVKMLEELGRVDDFDTITALAARRLRNRRLDYNFASLAALALTPLALDDATDLIFGRIDFITTLHTSALEQRLNESGIAAQVARGDQSSNSFLHAERSHTSAMVPAFVREQVQVELMRLDTLVATVDWFLDEAAERDKPQSADLFYEDEAGVWESPM
jgi:hypothetical protein